MRWLAVLGLLLAGARIAAADRVASADAISDEYPAPTRVTGRLAGTAIELTARFEVSVSASYESGIPVTIPEHAIVTGAVATAGGKPHVLELVDAAAAEKTMETFWSDDAPGENHRWAVHITGTDSLISMDVVAPTPTPTAKIVVDLTVEMPGCFYGDRRYALVPDTWFAQFAGAKAKADDDDLFATCAPDLTTDDHAWISFSAPELAKRPAGERRIGAFAGRLPLGHEDLARVEIDLAAELTRVPPDLHSAIVIDHSRSLTADEVETERAVVTSYLERVPAQSRVQVIAFARDATPLLAAWLPAGTAKARIDREIRNLAPRNGSNLDAAIAEAGRWLARAKGTRRLIVIGDDRLPARIGELTGAELKAMLPAGTLVHTVVASNNIPEMQLTDQTELGGLAALTEGISVTAGLDDKPHPTIDATMLVRPLGLDRVVIKGSGWEDMNIGTCPNEFTQLAEATSCEWWGKGTAVASAITFEAFLWGHKITRTLLPDATTARHLARELSAHNESFDDDLRNRIDRAAFAVNSAWSLLGSWGGAAGRTEGGFGFGRSGFGGGCCGSSHDTIGFTTGSVRMPLKLESQIAPIAKKCGATTAVTIELETTREEIVGVDVKTTESPAVQTCIEEGLWDLALAIPNAPWSATTIVKLPAP